MARYLGLLVIGALILSPTGALSDNHLVSSTRAKAQLLQASRERSEDVACVERALSSPSAASAAAALGVGIEGVKAAVPTLSDQEVRDLAVRASLIQANPVSGHYEEVNELLVVLLIVAIVVVVLSAAR